MPFWKKSNEEQKKKPESLPLMLCPQCKKPTLRRALNTGRFIASETYACEECGYLGAFYLEYDPEEKGNKFIDLEELKRLFPEDVEPETEIALNDDTLNPHKKKETKSKSP